MAKSSHWENAQDNPDVQALLLQQLHEKVTERSE
jgi:hypothetical protein